MNKENKENDNKDNVKLFKNWIEITLFILSLLIIFGYLLFSSGFIDTYYPKDSNTIKIITNVLFSLLNIIATFFITFKVAYYSYNSQNVINQKKIAKSSIRHIRLQCIHLDILIEMINSKMKKYNSENSTPLFFTIEEIRNHIISLKNDIKLSEFDFKDIVEEEYNEDSKIIAKFEFDIYKYEELIDEIEKLKEEKTSSNIEVDSAKSKINKLENELSDLQVKIDEYANKLNFPQSSLVPTSTGFINPSYNLNNYFDRPWAITGVNEADEKKPFVRYKRYFSDETKK